MAEHDRPLTAATLTSVTSNTRTEVEQPATEVLELYQLSVTNGRDVANNAHRNNCLYAPGTSTASLSSGETRVVPVRTVGGVGGTVVNRSSFTGSQDKKQPRAWTQVRQFWSKQVALAVPQKSNRDHYGISHPLYVASCLVHDLLMLFVALERTFLAYLRTSVVLSMQGVFIAQLFRLQRFTSQERYGLTYFDVAVPLSVTCHGMALVIVVVGAFRFWRQQSSITDGKVLAGGWELNSIGMMISLVSQRKNLILCCS